MSVKDWIIKGMSLQTMISEDVIRKVVDNQFAQAYDALTTCNSLEFSGFGKLYFNKRRAQRKMEKYLVQKKMCEDIIIDDSASEIKKRSATFKLKTLLNNIECLKPKLDCDD